MALSNVMELDELTENQADKFETHNDDLRRVQEAVAGTLNLTLPGDADYSLSTTTGSEEWRYKRIRVSEGSPSLTAARSIIYPNKAGPHMFIFENNTNQALTIKRSGQTGVSVLAGDMSICYHNGTDIVNAIETTSIVQRLLGFTSGIEYVDMGEGDYTLTSAQSAAIFYVIYAAVDGAVLYFNTDDNYPSDLRVFNLASGTTITAKTVGDVKDGVGVPYGEFRCITPVPANPQMLDSMINYKNATGERKSVNFSTDANYSIDGIYDSGYQYYDFTDNSSPTVLSTGRDVIFPTSKNIPRFIFKNSTAQTITVKVSGQTGIAVTAGTTKDLYWDGTDIADAGAL